MRVLTSLFQVAYIYLPSQVRPPRMSTKACFVRTTTMAVGQGLYQEKQGVVNIFGSVRQTLDPPTVACAVSLRWIPLSDT